MVMILGQKKPPTPAGLSGSAASAHVVDADMVNFEQEVIVRSMKTPVLVDLWATWCGPCKTLGPILEKLAADCAGSFVLAKVDVDANQEIAAALGVRSVPTVVLFLQGRPVDAFAGALPDAEIRKFLSKHIKLTAATPDAPASGGPADLLGQGRVAEALAALKRAADPVVEIRAALLSGDAARAEKLIQILPSAKKDEATDMIETATRVVDQLRHPSLELKEFHVSLSRNDLGPALDALLQLKTESARKLFLDLLTLMGRGPFSDDYRSRLAKLIFR